MIPIPSLEMDITHRCNLRCEGCAHYSNYGFRSAVPFPTGKAWLSAWAARVTPAKFGILGGEPGLHAELTDYVEFLAGLWPACDRILVSNGLVLHRHPSLYDVLEATDTKLEISWHSDTDERYLKMFMPRLAEIEGQVARRSIRYRLRRSQSFYKAYRGEGSTMRPFTEKDPEASFKVCDNKKCFSLHLNRVWKCPPLAFLNMVAGKFGLAANEEWQPYLRYRGVGLESSDEELADFFSRRSEWMCGMCPTTLERKPMHVLPPRRGPRMVERLAARDAVSA